MGQWKLLNFIAPALTHGNGLVFSKYKWRKLVLARDKDKCQNCLGAIKDVYLGRNYSNETHHIYARRHGGKNTLENGITLCKFCHIYYDWMYWKYDKDYYEIIEKKPREQRINEVRQMMHNRYLIHYLANNFE